MSDRHARMALLTVALAAWPVVALAQFPPPPPPPGQQPAAAPPPASAPAAPPVRDRWPDPPKPADPQPQRGGQAQAPARQRPAAAQDTPPPESDPDAGAGDPDKAPPPSKPAARPPAPAVSTAVACDGVFVKDSNHAKLALKYDARNIVYADVDGPSGTKIKASVLYPNDPRRRLEVVWLNEQPRTDLLVISINGRSQWTAPSGLKLGLPLAALEKANGRPFKISGFGPDGRASVMGWEGGGLAALPGGCKMGITLSLDSKAPQAARSALAGVKELMSNDASLKSVRPVISEILIGY